MTYVGLKELGKLFPASVKSPKSKNRSPHSSPLWVGRYLAYFRFHQSNFQYYKIAYEITLKKKLQPLPKFPPAKEDNILRKEIRQAFTKVEMTSKCGMSFLICNSRPLSSPCRKTLV